MKTFIKITALLCIITLLAGCGLVGESDKAVEKKEFENAVVTVNGKPISKEIFNYYFYSESDNLLKGIGIEKAEDIPEGFWEQKTDGKTNLEIAKEAALAKMIDEFLKYDKAIEEGISLTADEHTMIDNEIGQMKQNPEMIKSLEEMGMSTDAYEDFYAQVFYGQKLVLKYIEDGKIEVDKEKVSKELEANYVKAQHILLMTTDEATGAPLSEDKIAEKKALAEDILKRARSGENFDELMAEYGEDPGAKSQPEGYVFSTGQMVPEFEEAAYALNVNQISDIVETSYGYHIIKRVPFDLEGKQEKSYMIQYEYSLALPMMEDFVKEWKAEAKIEKNDKVYTAIKPLI